MWPDPNIDWQRSPRIRNDEREQLSATAEELPRGRYENDYGTFELITVLISTAFPILGDAYPLPYPILYRIPDLQIRCIK